MASEGCPRTAVGVAIALFVCHRNYMSQSAETPNLATIGGAIAGLPTALIPRSLKALDRLVGAAIDIPVAWLEQQKAKIGSQTHAYARVETAIASAAANAASTDPVIVNNAVQMLTRKAYRTQVNREAVAAEAIKDLSLLEDLDTKAAESVAPDAPIDADWLNVFERYAEDASTERMQNLWGRVLAGEIRQPGRFATRTLRFLSEFSRADGETFSEFCTSVFGDVAPNALVKPPGQRDTRHLIYLEASGVLFGTSGLGLTSTNTFDTRGLIILREGRLALVLHGNPGEVLTYECCALTPLGQELLSFLPGRDGRVAARRFANAIRVPMITSAALGTVVGLSDEIVVMEVFW